MFTYCVESMSRVVSCNNFTNIKESISSGSPGFCLYFSPVMEPGPLFQSLGTTFNGSNFVRGILSMLGSQYSVCRSFRRSGIRQGIKNSFLSLSLFRVNWVTNRVDTPLLS